MAEYPHDLWILGEDPGLRWRDAGAAHTKAVYLAISVNLSGQKDVRDASQL